MAACINRACVAVDDLQDTSPDETGSIPPDALPEPWVRSRSSPNSFSPPWESESERPLTPRSTADKSAQRVPPASGGQLAGDDTLVEVERRPGDSSAAAAIPAPQVTQPSQTNTAKRIDTSSKGSTADCDRELTAAVFGRPDEAPRPAVLGRPDEALKLAMGYSRIPLADFSPLSFGYVLVAFFCPPLYFLVRGRPIAFIVNGFVYLLAFPLVFLFGLGFLLWMFAASHAFWDLRNHNVELAVQRQARLIAEQMRRERS